MDCHIMNPNGTAHLTVAVPLRDIDRCAQWLPAHGGVQTRNGDAHSRSEIGRPQGPASPQSHAGMVIGKRLLGLVMLMVVKFSKSSIDKQACPDNPCSTWNSKCRSWEMTGSESSLPALRTNVCSLPALLRMLSSQGVSSSPTSPLRPSRHRSVRHEGSVSLAPRSNTCQDSETCAFSHLLFGYCSAIPGQP